MQSIRVFWIHRWRGGPSFRAAPPGRSFPEGSVETSLHNELKTHYADPEARFEVPLGRYRIDVVCGDRLVEVQHGSLAAIRDKSAPCWRTRRDRRRADHRPQAVDQTVEEGGRRVAADEPQAGWLIDLFDELVTTRVFLTRG